MGSLLAALFLLTFAGLELAFPDIARLLWFPRFGPLFRARRMFAYFEVALAVMFGAIWLARLLHSN